MPRQSYLDFDEDTDHHLKSIPRIPALSPLISPIPSPHPSFPPHSQLPDTARLVANQIFEKEWMSRTYFIGFGAMHCIATATFEVFCLFLNQLGFPCVYYREDPSCPWRARYSIISRLLSGGYAKLSRIGEEESSNATFYLVPASMIGVLSCIDLHLEQRWNHDLCCEQCHNGDFRNLNEIKDTDEEKFFTSYNGPEGRIARVCCRAWKLLPKWYLGKQYNHLPECLL